MHRLLKRQLKRYLASVEPIPKEWQSFVDIVDETYRQADTDRLMLERSLDLTSIELYERNQQLQEMIENLRETVARQEQAQAETEEARRQLKIALKEAQTIRGRYQRQSWDDSIATAKTKEYIHFQDTPDAESTPATAPPEGSAQETWLPTMTSAVRQAKTIAESDEEKGQTLALPIHLYGDTIGVLGFGSQETERWGDGEIAIVEDIVGQVGQALENRRLFDEAQQAGFLLGEQIKELDCLNDIGRMIDERPPIPEFLEWASERIAKAMQYSEICLVAIEFDSRVYGVAGASELPCQIVGGLRVGDEHVGQIIVAYTEDHSFLDRESALMGDVVRRISGYIENNHLIETSQAALAEAAETHRSYLRREWQDYLQKERSLRQNTIVYDQQQVTAVPDFWRPEMERALAQGSVATVEIRDEASPEIERETRTGLAIPIIVRGQTLGVLGIEDPSGERRWSAEELDLVQTISQQLGQVLENARLIDTTQSRAARERLTGAATARMRESLDMDVVLQTAIREIGQALNLHDATIRLDVDGNDRF